MSLQRLFGLAGNGENGISTNKKVEPTFGVSFGLPQSSQGYPINPYGSHPMYNPYGPAINGGGLNLGLVSVNPLLAVQVTKNDYGEKVVKPFVNLHVTPNEHVVNKIGHLFHEKKLYLLNKHEHFHHHSPYNPYGYQHLPSQSPHYLSNYGNPVYSPHYNYYQQPGHFKSHTINHERPINNDEEYYDDDDHYNDYNDYSHQNDYPGENTYYSPGYDRSSNFSNLNNKKKYTNRYAHSRSLTVSPNAKGVTRRDHVIKFPDSRKKRETNVDKSKETIEEVIHELSITR